MVLKHLLTSIPCSHVPEGSQTYLSCNSTFSCVAYGRHERLPGYTTWRHSFTALSSKPVIYPAEKEQPTLSDTPVKCTDRDLDQIHSWTTVGENGYDDWHLEDRPQTGFVSWAKPVKIVTDLNASIIGSRPYSAFIGQLEAQGNENFHHHSCLRV